MEAEERIKFNNTFGKKVRISYVPFKHLLDCNHIGIKPEKYYHTEGVIDYFNPPYIYIVNKNNCIEIFKLDHIYQMYEIDEL